MLAVKLICVGKLKESYWRDAVAEYEKRLRPLCKWELIELPEARLPNDPSPGEIEAALEKEGSKSCATPRGRCTPCASRERRWIPPAWPSGWRGPCSPRER